MTGDAHWYLPREVAERLAISTSTLRTYAANFSSLLSERARPTDADAKGFRHRRYDDGDLRVLGEAKALLDAGMSYQAVLARLGGKSLPRPTSRRRRPGRGRPYPVPAAPDAIPETASLQPPISAPPAEPPARLIVEGIDELRAEIQSLRADVAEARFTPEGSPTIDPIVIQSIAAELARIHERLANLEVQLAALTSPPRRPGWWARLLRRG